MNLSTKKIGFIGTGNMAEAIIKGLLTHRLVTAQQIFGLETNSERQKFIKKKYKISFCQNAEQLCQQTQIVIFCVKPQSAKESLNALQPYFKNHIFISIAAGIRLAFYQKILGTKAAIIRVMPNTPAQIGLGASAFYPASICTKAQQKICQTIFSSVGHIIQVSDEALIDSVTALSGSGPAFVYAFAQALIESGKKLGLDPQVSSTLALQTLRGATEMLIQSDEPVQHLINQVTSKGGTTLAGLDVLHKNSFAKIIEDCLKAAKQRAKELSQEFGE